MKLFKEKDALRSILEISNNPEKAKKKCYADSIVSLILFILIAVLLMFTTSRSFITYLLSFFAGIWLIWSYTKFTEGIGVTLIAKYIDIDKVKSMYMELGGALEMEEKKEGMNPILKTLLTIVSWAVAAIIILYVIDYIKTI